MSEPKTPRKTDYTNDAQQRIIKVMLVLFSDAVKGLSPTALAREVNCSPAVMTRDINNLLTAGIAEKVESTGMIRLTTRLPQQSIKVWTAIERADRELQEAKNRFNRNPD